jgi:hypothetical protein
MGPLRRTMRLAGSFPSCWSFARRHGAAAFCSLGIEPRPWGMTQPAAFGGLTAGHDKWPIARAPEGAAICESPAIQRSAQFMDSTGRGRASPGGYVKPTRALASLEVGER